MIMSILKKLEQAIVRGGLENAWDCCFMGNSSTNAWQSSYKITVHHIKFDQGLIDHSQSVRRRGHLVLKTMIVHSE